MAVQITNQQARQTILQLQGLTHSPHVKFQKGELLKLIDQLGFVQVDSIQWVERAQHMTLFARNQTYRPKHLADLIEKERVLFENWTHDASIIPTSLFCYWRHRFDREREKLARQFTRWQGEGYDAQRAELMQRVQKDGALKSRDLERQTQGPQKMWQWHDGKAALEFLWRTGDLCISKREGFQKVYDLTERGLQEGCLAKRVSHDEFIDWSCRSALERLGFGTASDIARYWDGVSIAEARDWLEEQGANSVVDVEVSGIKKGDMKTLSARADIQSVIADIPDIPKRIRTLSPFDPVIRDRKRLSWLFGFDYRIEIYVPEAKRIWGYYVFPLLEGDRVIGRIDMRAHRKNDQLEIKKLWLEPKIRFSDARKTRLEAELVRQARLANVSEVAWLDGSLPN